MSKKLCRDCRFVPVNIEFTDKTLGLLESMYFFFFLNTYRGFESSRSIFESICDLLDPIAIEYRYIFHFLVSITFLLHRVLPRHKTGSMKTDKTLG